MDYLGAIGVTQVAVTNKSGQMITDMTCTGAPTNGATFSYAGKISMGARITDISNGITYTNIGSSAVPSWALPSGSQSTSLSPSMSTSTSTSLSPSLSVSNSASLSTSLSPSQSTSTSASIHG